MNSEELGEFFLRQGLDDYAGWLGYVDDDGKTWVPEIAAIIDDWTFGQMETIIQIRSNHDYAMTNFAEVGPSIDWLFHRDEDGHFLRGSRHQKPEKQPYGVSAYGAEHLVRDWLKYLGFDDAITTQFRRDEGVDVITEEFDVQVKNWTSDFIPVSAIREIFGVAISRHKKPMFFSHSDYSYDSLDFAEKVAMPLFRFKPETAEITSCNKFAEEILLRQNSHQEDIKKLRDLWIGSIETEVRARHFLNLVADVLANSQVDKFEKASPKFRISLDFDKPTFQHEDSQCLSQTVEACFEQVFLSFKKLTPMRQESGRVLESLVFDVECGVFD